MSTTQHTPGPWLIDEDDMRSDPDAVFSIGIWAGGSTAPDSDASTMVANVSAFGLHTEDVGGTEVVTPAEPEARALEMAKANARLIAAAPDLLEALQEVLAILPVCPQNTGVAGIEARYNAAVVGARNVIRQATGATP